MRITKLILENIKAYENETFEFNPGINFICGQNGRGKSTIFESIGFVLFDKLEYLQEHFIRYGEKKAAIKLWFEAIDERLYCIIRHLGTSKKYYILDDQTGVELDLHGIEDVQNWLKENLAEAIELPLGEIFSQIIGVYQGTFTEPFLLKGEKRIAHFNKLLQIEQYKKAVTQSSNYETFFNDFIRDKNTAIDLALLEIKHLREKEIELQDNNKKIVTLELEVQSLTKTRLQREESLAVLEAKKKALELLAIQADKLQYELVSSETLITQKRLDLQQAEQAKLICAGTKEVYIQTTAAREQLAFLKPSEEQFASIQKELIKLNSVMVSINAQRKEKALQLAKLASRSNVEVSELQLMRTSLESDLRDTTALFNDLEQSLSAYKKHMAVWDRVADLRRLIIEDTEKIKHSYVRVAQLSEEILNLQLEASRLRLLEPCVRSFAEISAQCLQLQEDLTAVKTRSIEYSRFEAILASGQCPFFETKCNNLILDPEQQLLYTREKMEESIAILNLQIESQNIQREQALKLVDEYNGLPRIETRIFDITAEISQLVTEIDLSDLRNNLQKIINCFLNKKSQKQIDGFSPVQLDIDRFYAWRGEGHVALTSTTIDINILEEAMRTLDNVLKALRLDDDSELTIITEKRDSAGSQIKLTRSLKEAGELKQKKLDEDNIYIAREKLLVGELETQFFLIEDQVKQLTTEVGLLQPDVDKCVEYTNFIELNRTQFEQYLINIPLAEKQNVFLAELTAHLSNQSQLQFAISELKVQQKIKADDFDEGKLFGAVAARDELSAQISAGTAEIRLYSLRNQELTQGISKIRGFEQEITVIEREKTQAVRKLELIQLSRKVLSKIGEPIAGMFRRKIARLAEGIYHNISEQHVRLVWGEGYEVMLDDYEKGRDRRRTFYQLSGGEQMSVALAVRMALIQYFSNLRIAFFDEPTTNLDEVRRQNLAAIMPKICKDFDQVFLISHDDTFDSITDNVLLL